jgi:hypothetical protein
MYRAGRLKELRMLPALAALAMLVVCNSAAAASLVFNYPNGFAGASSAIQTGGSVVFSGSGIQLTSGTGHQGGGAWYKTQQNISSFATSFTFKFASGLGVPSTAGITFCIQNSNSTTNSYDNQYGLNAYADANMSGYGAYWNIPGNANGIQNSVAIKFDLNNESGANTDYPASGAPNTIGLYVNGGPSAALVPHNDLNPSGINLYSGHVMSATVVYDGSLLTLTLQDTVTNAQLRMSWPVNIPAAVGSNTAWIGFTGGSVEAAANSTILTWSFSEGYNTRLATPTLSPAPGQYAGTQSVSISGPAGATIYYTTNGQQPTTSSSQYTGPISISSNEVVQAVAIQSGYTDSYVATAPYQIGTSNAINFPSGFANASNQLSLVGTTLINGSSVQLTDTARNNEVGAAWYVAPVNVQSFTTNFTLQFGSPSQANGMTFCIQNQPPASKTTGPGGNTSSWLWVSGGTTTLASSQAGLGYSGMTGGVAGQLAGIVSSVAVKFDLYSGTGNDTGLYINGADVSQNGISMNSSGLSLHSGHPLAVTVSYNGTTLSMTITDTVSHASYSNSWAINIPTTVGGNTAYVGFTGSTGGEIAGQNIVAWTYSSQGQATTQAPPPVPMAPTNLSIN